MSAVNLAILPLGHIAEIANSFDWRQACGYLASALVLATFWMRQMAPLRVVAICSNLAFFSYAVLLGLPPVGILHAVLLPVNVWRLRQLTDRAGNADRPARLGSRAAMRGLSKGGLAVGLSQLLVGAAASNTSDDEIHCRIENWRAWSQACHHFAKAEYLLVAHAASGRARRVRISQTARVPARAAVRRIRHRPHAPTPRMAHSRRKQLAKKVSRLQALWDPLEGLRHGRGAERVR